MGSLIISLIFMTSMALLPVYVFKSGGVQPAHMLLSLACLLSLFYYGIRFDKYVIIILLLFVYVFIRESVSIMIAGYNWETLLPAVYFMYNLVVFSIVKVWLEKNSASYMYFISGIFWALLVAFIGIYVLGYSIQIGAESNFRAVGTFNNPNQLGYFSVAAASITALLFMDKVISKYTFAVLLSICLYLAIMSLSKAAMVSIVLVLPLLISAFITLKKRVGLFHLVCASILCVLIGLYIANTEWVEQYKFYHRIADIGSAGDDSLEARGYFAIYEFNALEWIFGFGADKAAQVVGHEVHSTIWSVLVNYGLIGFILFAAFLFEWCKKIYHDHKYLGLVAVVAPPMLYGLTHNGTRFTIFWLLISLSFVSTRSISFYLSKDYSKSFRRILGRKKATVPDHIRA